MSMEDNAIPAKTAVSAVVDANEAPTQPGCYLMRDAHGQVLYVGKAKNLRARVRNYINETDSRYSVKFLMRRVARIEYLVVASEKEALLLENSLIKAHKPRYNVRLRDDKTYVSIRLDPRETFPRLTVVRKRRNDGARYFGPYHDTRAARKTLKQMQKLTPLRVCSNHVLANRTRPCVYYQIKQCLAPCVGLIASDAYADVVKQALMVLEGRSNELEKNLLARIRELSEALQFEEAAVVRDRLYDLRATVAPQRAVMPGQADQCDVWGFHAEGRSLELQVLYYRNQAMVGGRAFSFDHMEAPLPEIISSFLLQYYAETPTIPREILTPLLIEDQDALAEVLEETRGAKATVRWPQRGNQTTLTALANANAQQAFEARRGHEKAVQDMLEQTQKTLHLNSVPHRVECFDISTIQGSRTVAAMVVFTEGEPDKQRYRRFSIKGIDGQDDFAAMREVLTRRYTRALEENDFPDLVLIDGGKGHLNVALAALQDLGLSHLPCASIAKSRAEEDGASPERFFIPGRMNPIVPPQNGPVVRFLSRVRDETHRFAITYHRQKRGKETLTSVLRNIPGVGPARVRTLLRAFGSLSRLRDASREQVAAVPGISDTLAAQIVAALHREA